MKRLLPLIFLVMLSASQAAEDKITMAQFSEWCRDAHSIANFEDGDAKIPTERLANACMGVGFIKGYFVAAQNIQRLNPDVRVVDPAWKGASDDDILAVVLSRLDHLKREEAKGRLDMTVDEFMAVLVRSRSKTPDLTAPR